MENDDFPPPLKVGIAYNLKKSPAGGACDMEAEYDSYETIAAIKNVFESAGLYTALLEADSDFTEKVKKSGVDIVFNIAEGTNGRGREAQVPAILSFLGIPCTGSDETTLAVSLDKAMTKRYLSTFGVTTPNYQYVEKPDFVLDKTLRFPLIVKPDSEGSSKGIADFAVADGEKQLFEIVRRDFEVYGEPMLIEEYITGREFTVGVIGNGGGISVFEPMEICYLSKERKNRIYNFRVKKDYKKYVTYKCLSDAGSALRGNLKDTAVKIYSALKCRDFSRIDFRVSDSGTVYFIEINPLPGLAPGYSDYPMLASLCGVDYRTLLLSVLNSSLSRYGMEPVAVERGDAQ